MLVTINTESDDPIEVTTLDMEITSLREFVRVYFHDNGTTVEVDHEDLVNIRITENDQ